MRKIIAAIGLWLALTGGAAAQTCAAYPFTFSPGTTIASSQVNSNFSSIRTCANTALAPLLAPTFTGPVTITGSPLGIGSGGTGATTLAGANIATFTGTPAVGNIATFSTSSGQIQDGGTTIPIWTTGDAKLTLKTVADSGWILLNDGSIGDAISGGTTRANADTSALFTLVWTNCADAQCPVSGGRGASAAADFAANKNITLPLTLGRALAVAGSGSGLTARPLGTTTGAETHSISIAEMPAHTHSAGSLAVDPNILTGLITGSGPQVIADSGGNAFTQGLAAGPVTRSANTSTAVGGSTGSNGSGTAMSLMQPSAFAFNVMVKL